MILSSLFLLLCLLGLGLDAYLPRTYEGISHPILLATAVRHVGIVCRASRFIDANVTLLATAVRHVGIVCRASRFIDANVACGTAESPHTLYRRMQLCIAPHVCITKHMIMLEKKQGK